MFKDTKNASLPTDTSGTKYAQVPVWLLRAGKEVSHGAVRLYAVIKSYTRNGQNTAFPSQKTLARDLGVSERQIHTYIHQLKGYEALYFELHKNDDGTRGRNYVYTLVWEDPKQQKKTSGVIAEENFRSGDDQEETAEENFQWTPEENFRSIAEENFRLTTPTELHPIKTKNPRLGRNLLSSTENDFVSEEFSEDEIAEKRVDKPEPTTRQSVPPPPEFHELLDELWGAGTKSA